VEWSITKEESMKGTNLAPIRGDIVKSNLLVEAKYDLTLTEQKLILMAISKIDPASRKRNVVPIRIREFCNLIGSTQERYTEIREILRNLRKKEILITQYNNSRDIKEELIAGWIDTAHYKNGEVEIEFPNKLMPYLVELKERYTVYNIRNIANLTSKHAIRIYELMKEYEYRKGFVIEYEKLKEIICGLDKFDRYYDFKKRVLIPSQDDISSKTDISFEYTEIRSGKKLQAIEFKISKNKMVIKQRENEKTSAERYSYYGDSDVVSVVNRYKQKSKEELVDELFDLMEDRYNISLPKEELYEYCEKTLMNVIFKIVDCAYENVLKPIPYFRAVLKKEEDENN
jgi:plasmid replication initiation protein